MTPEEHNKALGICHLAYGGLSIVMMLAVLFFFGAIMFSIPDGGPPAGFLVLVLGFVMLWSFVLTLPSFIAGYAILRHKAWARTASIVAAVLETMSFPLGTAVAIYSFWFMFSDAGKSLYDQTYARTPGRPYALGDAPPAPPPASEWEARTRQQQGREREYVPPTQPPDWRSQ